VLYDNSLNLSILLSVGTENNYDTTSNGERTQFTKYTDIPSEFVSLRIAYLVRCDERLLIWPNNFYSIQGV